MLDSDSPKMIGVMGFWCRLHYPGFCVQSSQTGPPSAWKATKEVRPKRRSDWTLNIAGIMPSNSSWQRIQKEGMINILYCFPSTMKKYFTLDMIWCLVDDGHVGHTCITSHQYRSSVPVSGP